MKELKHIHNKVVFDAFNESLDSYRLFGLKGKPFPWKITGVKPIKNYKSIIIIIKLFKK